MLEFIRQDSKAFGRSGSVFSILYLVFFSSGFLALFCYRLYAPLWRKGQLFRVFAKLIERFSQIVTACYIEPEARIAGGVHLPHGVGIVIGAGVIIEPKVTIYQHVTIGRKHKDKPETPILREGVTIYAHAVVVGDIEVPENANIPALCLVKEQALFKKS